MVLRVRQARSTIIRASDRDGGRSGLLCRRIDWRVLHSVTFPVLLADPAIALSTSQTRSNLSPPLARAPCPAKSLQTHSEQATLATSSLRTDAALTILLRPGGQCALDTVGQAEASQELSGHDYLEPIFCYWCVLRSDVLPPRATSDCSICCCRQRFCRSGRHQAVHWTVCGCLAYIYLVSAAN